MYKIAFLLAAAAIIFLGYSQYTEYTKSKSSEFVQLTLNRDVIDAEVVRSITARTQGLSGRTSLEPNTGMLFVFPETQYPSIWMKDMNFAIDIIFIDAGGKVVAIFENASPESYREVPPRIFKTLEASRYVLEVPAGTVADTRLRTGMDITELSAFR